MLTQYLLLRKLCLVFNNSNRISKLEYLFNRLTRSFQQNSYINQEYKMIPIFFNIYSKITLRSLIVIFTFFLVYLDLEDAILPFIEDFSSFEKCFNVTRNWIQKLQHLIRFARNRIRFWILLTQQARKRTQQIFNIISAG